MAAATAVVTWRVMWLIMCLVVECCVFQVDALSNLIPSNTKISTTVTVNASKACCDLVLATNNSQTVIRGAVLFGEQIFDGESLFVYPKVGIDAVLLAK